MKCYFSLLVTGLLLVLFSYSFSQVPLMINYQGKLTMSSGAPLDTTISMVFSIYADSAGTTLLWTETQGAVVVNKGAFNVLLGSTTPIGYLVFDGTARWLGVKVGGDPEITPRLPMVSVPYAYRAATDGGWTINGNDVYHYAGNVGIRTTSTQYPLEVYGIIGLTGTGLDLYAPVNDLVIATQSGQIRLNANSNKTVIENGNLIVLSNVGIGTSNPQASLDVVGHTRTQVLEITGGIDLAEPFAMSESDNLAPGTVVVIDPENPGQLKMSTHAYDLRVAGIVSGAGGVNPGLTLRQQGLSLGGQNVALCGRVYCWADASYGSIQSGDLLTTSDTAGHAMKVKDMSRAQGAIIGKAMSSLSEGRGLVLVLVSLQ